MYCTPWYHRLSQVDGGENLRQLTSLEQTSPPEPDAKWNQQQTEYKNAREDQKDQKAYIRMRGPRQENVIEPEGDGGERRARGDHGARQRYGILSQEIDWLRPVSYAFSQSHLKPQFPFLYAAPSRHTTNLAAGSSAALDDQPDLDGRGRRYFFNVRM
jgi:hypothetical protein